MREITQQIENWTGDRKIIAMKAITDIANDATPITLYNGSELIGIATLNGSELLNLATKRGGTGAAMLELIAEYAISNDTHIEGMSTDQAVFFYCKNGWEVEGYPGENNGVPIWWSLNQIQRFMSDDRDEYLAEAAEVCAEYREECEL